MRLRLGRGEGNVCSRMTLRSERVLATPDWAGVDRRDFGDMITMHAEGFDGDGESQKKYIKIKGGKKTDRLIFETEKVRDWVKMRNAEIRRKIAARLHDGV